MSINPNIALQIKPPTFASPFEQSSQVMGLMGLLQQQKLREAQLKQAAEKGPLELENLRAQAALHQAQAQAAPINAQSQAALRLQQLLNEQNKGADFQRKSEGRNTLMSLLGLPTEEQALSQAREMDARGQPFRIEAQNPRAIQAAAVQAGIPMRDIVGNATRGTVVGPGAGYIPPGGASPAFIMPFAPKSDPAPTVRVVPDAQNPGKFVYEDMRNPGKPLAQAPAPAGAAKIELMGGRESVFLNRVLTASNQVNKDLTNIVEQPISATRGIFGGRGQGPSLFEAAKEALTTKMTTQEVQSYNVLATGIQRNLAAIEAAGLAPPNSLMHMMDAVIFKEGDSNFTKLQKLAQTRQIVEAGLETILANPRVSEGQKKHAEDMLEGIRKAVPFNGRDLIKLGALQQSNPNATLREVMEAEKRGGGGAPKAALDYLKSHPETKGAFKAKYGYLPEGM